MMKKCPICGGDSKSMHCYHGHCKTALESEVPHFTGLTEQDQARAAVAAAEARARLHKEAGKS